MLCEKRSPNLYALADKGCIVAWQWWPHWAALLYIIVVPSQKIQFAFLTFHDWEVENFRWIWT